MQALAPIQRDAIRRIIAAHKTQPGPLLEVLHGVQHELGFVPPGAVALIAEELNLSRAEVHGVVTFYHHFRKTPPGRHTVQICRAESCQSMGAEALAAHAKQRLGVGFEQTTPDGVFSLDAVYCLGLCASSPAVMVDGDVYGRVTPEQLDGIIDERGRQK
jgi:formate dehydrogenase subunit gamma